MRNGTGLSRMRLCGAAFVVLASVGCQPHVEPSVDRIGTASEFIGEGGAPALGNLILAGTVVPIDVRSHLRGKLIHLELAAHGEVVEEELYENGASGFAVVEAGGETYLPPVPLLRFPLDVGDKWTWSGTTASGPVRHPATAVVTTSRESLNVPGGPYSAVRVRVELKYLGEASKPAIRALDFWFAPNKGVVKRQFGASSTREPRQVATR